MPFKNSQSMINVYVRLTEQINDAVDRAIDFYHQECKRLGYPSPKWNHGTIVDVFKNHILIEWEEYALSCRTDWGNYSIPIAAIFDDTYQETITKIVQDDVETLNKKKALDIEKQLEYKRIQLQKLKQELGED